MYKRIVGIVNKGGLHARPASDFVRAAGAFFSSISIRSLPDGASGNAKSIISLLSLGLGPGIEVELAAEGEDEAMAVDSLAALIASGFGEI